MQITYRLMFVVMAWATLSAQIAIAKQLDLGCKAYPYAGGAKKILLHPRSFADTAICPGGTDCFSPENPIKGYNNIPDKAIGPPDYSGSKAANSKKSDKFYSLGCHRSATWRFDDNALTNVDGPDLFVFEIGTRKEPTRVELSKNGKDWRDVGQIAGGNGTIDFKSYVSENEIFRFVRLTDLGFNCSKPRIGADIDAIAAMAFAWTVVEDETTQVFFDSGKSELTDEAEAALIQQFHSEALPPGYRLQIIGHTDDIGTTSSNRRLSISRAEAVSDLAVEAIKIDRKRVSSDGRGEDDPVASNGTASGRKKNRRVELTFLPPSSCGGLEARQAGK
ncbi:MAG: OmpA family protein [Pseudomonadota bacterium]